MRKTYDAIVPLVFEGKISIRKFLGVFDHTRTWKIFLWSGVPGTLEFRNNWVYNGWNMKLSRDRICITHMPEIEEDFLRYLLRKKYYREEHKMVLQKMILEHM